MRRLLFCAAYIAATAINAAIWWLVPCEWSRPYGE